MADLSKFEELVSFLQSGEKAGTLQGVSVELQNVPERPEGFPKALPEPVVLKINGENKTPMVKGPDGQDYLLFHDPQNSGGFMVMSANEHAHLYSNVVPTDTAIRNGLNPVTGEQAVAGMSSHLVDVGDPQPKMLVAVKEVGGQYQITALGAAKPGSGHMNILIDADYDKLPEFDDRGYALSERDSSVAPAIYEGQIQKWEGPEAQPYAHISPMSNSDVQAWNESINQYASSTGGNARVQIDEGISLNDIKEAGLRVQPYIPPEMQPKPDAEPLQQEYSKATGKPVSIAPEQDVSAPSLVEIMDGQLGRDFASYSVPDTLTAEDVSAFESLLSHQGSNLNRALSLATDLQDKLNDPDFTQDQADRLGRQIKTALSDVQMGFKGGDAEAKGLFAAYLKEAAETGVLPDKEQFLKQFNVESPEVEVSKPAVAVIPEVTAAQLGAPVEGDGQPSISARQVERVEGKLQRNIEQFDAKFADKPDESKWEGVQPEFRDQMQESVLKGHIGQSETYIRWAVKDIFRLNAQDILVPIDKDNSGPVVEHVVPGNYQEALEGLKNGTLKIDVNSPMFEEGRPLHALKDELEQLQDRIEVLQDYGAKVEAISPN